jgi:hypothetical protein
VVPGLRPPSIQPASAERTAGDERQGGARQLASDGSDERMGGAAPPSNLHSRRKCEIIPPDAPHMTNLSGLTPEEWESRLEEATDRPDRLAKILKELDHEMRQERTWLHENPEPGDLFKTILEFLGRPEDDDLERLGSQIRSEIQKERWLKERYRSWLPGEVYLDRLFRYLKDFGGEVSRDDSGLQFPGFLKYKGIRREIKDEVFAFYLSERFPGRDPANFHVAFDASNGDLLIKRVYKVELPVLDGMTTVGRAVLSELIRDVVPSPSDIRAFVVDNAANISTRQALIGSRKKGNSVVYEPRPDCNVASTPLGNLMLKLALEMGLTPGGFHFEVRPFGMLRIELDILPPAGAE